MIQSFMVRFGAAFGLLSLALAVMPGASAQEVTPPQRAPVPFPGVRPPVRSPEVHPDRKVTFRILAPKAEEVGLRGDLAIPGGPRGGRSSRRARRASGRPRSARSTRGPIGTRSRWTGSRWSTRATPRSSETNTTVWSLVSSRARTFMDTKDVPHGAVAEVYYQSRVARADPPDARLHAAGVRGGPGQVPGLLPAARGRRLRRLVEHRRPRRLHPRQPDRGRRRPGR